MAYASNATVAGTISTGIATAAPAIATVETDAAAVAMVRVIIVKSL